MAGGVQADTERHIWDLLTRDFSWEVPAEYPVKVYGRGEGAGPARLQLFEVVVTTVLAQLRPEYVWHVSPNTNDGGLDFEGKQGFLNDTTLGIAAAITVGGQCKKRTTVGDVLDEIAGSVLKMTDHFDPTLVIVALSARVAPRRIEQARAVIERQCRRHCHILDRVQIEGLISEHLAAVDEVLRAALAESEVEEVLHYFDGRRGANRVLTVDVDPPARVLAGVPFSIDVTVRSTLVSNPRARIWWRLGRQDGEASHLTLIGPLGADGASGAALGRGAEGDDPLYVRHSLELITYAVGQAELGEVLVGLDADGITEPWSRTSLGRLLVVDNVRPRFFDRPFREALNRLSSAYDRAKAGAVVSVGVVGAGGSGKTRMCEEFALEQRRQGSDVVTAKQTKTHDDPHRVVADLLLGLTGVNIGIHDDPADIVIEAIRLYDRRLAQKVGPAVRAMFGTHVPADGPMTDQDQLSALLVLITARVRRAPLVIHLQDLHWCTADVLKLLERLVWQLEQVFASPNAARAGGVLIIFEGRVRESDDSADQAWSSVPFEAFLDRVDGTIVPCSSFSREDGLDFTSRLFEDRHSANRLVSDDLLALQRELVRQIDRSSGGNPFHTLAQVQLLKERRILGHNPDTGLLYTIRPQPDDTVLPDSVFASIQLRWRYLQQRQPDLALLLWACSLLEDRIPIALFRRLRQALAPSVSVRDVDATDLLWTGDGTQQEVVFRHENYFEGLRRFDVSGTDRDRAVQAYSRWFAGFPKLSPADRFRWARVLLEGTAPDRAMVGRRLRTAQRGAERQGDTTLARRILAAALDQVWADDVRSPIALSRFLARSDDELQLLRMLLDCDRPEAERRIESMRVRLQRRVSTSGRLAVSSQTAVQRRQLAAEVVYAQYLFNDQHPERAAEIAENVVRTITTLRAGPLNDAEEWDALEMEALHTHAVALAIGGEVGPAVPLSARAVELAERIGSSRGRQVIGTHGNILLAVDPDAGVALLRDCLARAVPDGSHEAEADRVEIHLAIGLAILAHRCLASDPARASTIIAEARQRLTRVVGACLRLGLYPDVAAASLMLGILATLDNDDGAVSWFAQAVAAAARGRQTETLWKAHIDLALALYAKHNEVTQTVRDHAAAALDIMEESLSAFADPDQSPRFDLLRLPLAHAARLLVLAGDDAGFRALAQHPGLRECFLDPAAGLLRPDRDAAASDHEWTLRIGELDYVLY